MYTICYVHLYLSTKLLTVIKYLAHSFRISSIVWLFNGS